jgi:stage V sporulation protein R
MNATPEPNLSGPARESGSDLPASDQAKELANLDDHNPIEARLPLRTREVKAPTPLLGPGRPTLSEDLRDRQIQIENAARDHGLSFYPIVYEMLYSREINAIAARDGFPIRYPHWRFGMEYEFLNTGYEHASSKIYELVINSDPVYAYLMASNEHFDQEFVMCHVTGHADFFRNNIYFSQTNRQSIDMMATHAHRVAKYMHVYGRDEVEKVIDHALSISDLIDPFKMLAFPNGNDKQSSTMKEEPLRGQPGKLPVTRDYLESFINPPEALEAARIKEEKLSKKPRQFPEKPVRDVLQFLIENAPIPDWQRDILSIVREESYYFLPQMQTKIMNEGWASYWHSTLMRQEIVKDKNHDQHAQLHSSITASQPPNLNPYKIGIELFRDIEDRWNKGQFGPEWEACTNEDERKRWDKKLGLGREKIFEVRRLNNDLSFISNYLTMDFCERHQLYTFDQNAVTGDYVMRSREFEKVRDTLIRQLVNCGKPLVELIDGNLHNRGEIRLMHHFDKDPLRQDYTEAVLKSIHFFWTRPVCIDTKRNGVGERCTFDQSGYRRFKN